MKRSFGGLRCVKKEDLADATSTNVDNVLSSGPFRPKLESNSLLRLELLSIEKLESDTDRSAIPIRERRPSSCKSTGRVSAVCQLVKSVSRPKDGGRRSVSIAICALFRLSLSKVHQ